MILQTLTYTRVEVAEHTTAAAFWRDASETRKNELIDGVMIMPSPPSRIHEDRFSFLFRLIGDYVEQRQLGLVFGSRTAVELAVDQVYEPDILFVADERTYIVGDKGIIGAPDFVIDILSASTAHHDRGTKRYAYEHAGVREYWIVDPYGPAGTEFYHLRDGSFFPVVPNSENLLRSVAIDGFVIDARWLWQSNLITVKDALAQIAAWNQK